MTDCDLKGINLTKVGTGLLFPIKDSKIMQGKGWFLAMAITIAVVWWGVNYIFPWK
jgi:hypothetical protein